jgi:hypothetical protein
VGHDRFMVERGRWMDLSKLQKSARCRRLSFLSTPHSGMPQVSPWDFLKKIGNASFPFIILIVTARADGSAAVHTG